MTPTSHQHLDISTYPVNLLVKLVSELLETVIKTNDTLNTYSNENVVTHFHSRAVPDISIQTYLIRILRYTPFRNEVLLSILIYFDRIVKLKNTQYALSSLTVHRLLITSIVVASKFTSDVFSPNKRYAKVGGLSLFELNQLELKFLFLCNFDLYVKLEEMQAYGDQLLTHALTKQNSPLIPPIELSLSLSVPLDTRFRKRKQNALLHLNGSKEKKKAKKSKSLLDQAFLSFVKVSKTTNTSTMTSTEINNAKDKTSFIVL